MKSGESPLSLLPRKKSGNPVVFAPLPEQLRGKSDFDHLSPEEQAIFDRWARQVAGAVATVAGRKRPAPIDFDAFVARTGVRRLRETAGECRVRQSTK